MSENKIVAIVKRKNGKLINFTATSPLWIKETSTGRLLVSLPFFGLEFVVSNQDQIDAHANACVESWLILSEENGRGIEWELEQLGWHKAHKIGSYNFTDDSYIGSKLIDTGYPFMLNLQYA